MMLMMKKRYVDWSDTVYIVCYLYSNYIGDFYCNAMERWCWWWKKDIDTIYMFANFSIYTKRFGYFMIIHKVVKQERA